MLALHMPLSTKESAIHNIPKKNPHRELEKLIESIPKGFLQKEIFEKGSLILYGNEESKMK